MRVPTRGHRPRACRDHARDRSPRNVCSSAWSACLPAMIEAAERDPAVRKLQRKITTQRRKLLVSLILKGLRPGSCRRTSIPEMAARLPLRAHFRPPAHDARRPREAQRDPPTRQPGLRHRSAARPRRLVSAPLAPLEQDAGPVAVAVDHRAHLQIHLSQFRRKEASTPDDFMECCSRCAVPDVEALPSTPERRINDYDHSPAEAHRARRRCVHDHRCGPHAHGGGY